jgi:hypothetical protein
MVCVLLCVVVCALALPFIASQSPFNYFVLSNQQTHTETWPCSDNYSVSFCFFQAFPFTASLTHPSSRLRQTDKRHQSTNKSIKPFFFSTESNKYKSSNKNSPKKHAPAWPGSWRPCSFQWWTWALCGSSWRARLACA